MNSKVENIYQLEGRVPVSKAIPFGLQHILAMFVANIAPIIIVAGACGLSSKDMAMLIQSAMIIAGIGTIIQLYPVWRLGSGLPIVMGISFTFVSIFCYIGPAYGYEAIIGAVLIGGLAEGILGLLAKYWTRFITPVVAASVVTAIGFSLLSVGAASFGGGSGSADFGSAKNLILGGITLACCIGFNIFAKSFWKQLSVLFGLVVGYVVAAAMGMVDFSALSDASVIALPKLMPFKPVFHPGAIVSVFLIFLVSATETIGDTSALASSGLGKRCKGKGNGRVHRLRRFHQFLVSGLRLPAEYIFQPERGASGYDQSGQPLHPAHGRHHHDFGRTVSDLRNVACHFARCSARRLHDHDVRDHCGQRHSDDLPVRLQPEKYQHRGPVSQRGDWIYPGAGNLFNLSADRAKCVCRELCSGSLPGGDYLQSDSAERHGIKERKS